MQGSLAIYNRLPVFLQHAAVSAQGAMYRWTRYGGVFEKHFDYLKRTEFLPADELAALQTGHLLHLIEYVLPSIPYYTAVARSNGLRAADFKSLGDLRKLPFTTKHDVRTKRNEFLTQTRSSRGLIDWHTSGTTGTPLKFSFTPEAFQKTFAFLELYRQAAGLSRRARRAQFTGKPIIPAPRSGSPRTFWRYDIANRAIVLSTTHLSFDNLPSYCDAITRYHPDAIIGYPSAIYLLAQHYASSGRPMPRLKAILTSAETVLSYQRSTIESVFQAKLYDQYGQSELQSFWYECSHGSMHIHPLAGVTEILLPDGSPAPPGQYGEVVVTGFQNLAMPLLRYRTGDSARLSDRTCPCGRQMPVVDGIYGRLEDYIYTSERGFVGRLDPVFKGVEHIVESQIVQESLELLRIFYVPTPEMLPADLSHLEDNLRAKVGDRIRLEFIPVPSIAREGGGKFRAVISKLPANIRSGMIEQSRLSLLQDGENRQLTR